METSCHTVAPMKGWITTFYQTYKGKRLGPYYARSWKVNGKLKREYLKPVDVERIRAACEAHREKRKAQRDCAHHLTRLSGNLNYINRMAKRADKGPLRNEDYAFLHLIETNGYDITGRPPLKQTNPERRRLACTPDPGRPARLSQNKTQRRQVFMYPLNENSGNRSLNAKRSTLSALRSILFHPKHEKLKAESDKEKLKRWTAEMHALPRATANAQYILPNWITRKEVHNFVDRCIKLDVTTIAEPDLSIYDPTATDQ